MPDIQQEPKIALKKPVRTLCLHNVTWSVHTRSRRAQVPGKHKFVHRIGGGKIIVRRARHAVVRESVLQEHFTEIKRLVDDGMLEVRTGGGERVDINTLKVSPLPKTPPLKKKPVEVINDAALLTEETVDQDEITPSAYSESVQSGDAPVTHSEEADPAKRRRKKRGGGK